MILAPPLTKKTARDRERLYTAEDLLAMPPEARFELIEGKLCPMPPTSDWHGESTISLSGRILVFVEDNDLGSCRAAETGFLLARDPDVVLAPDFAFIRKERLTYQRTQRGFVPIAPDLVVETRSPGDRSGAVAKKMALWLSYGVTAGIDVRPIERALTIHRRDTPPVTLTSEDILTLPDLLPGFVLPLARLFR